MEFAMHDVGVGHYRVEGDLDQVAATNWIRFCRESSAAPDRTIRLDLADLEIDTGPACALAVDAIRALVDRGIHPVLVRAPQELAHVLYRVGMLPVLTLVDPREEMPTSS